MFRKPTTENRDLETETSGESDCEGPDSPLDGGRRLYPIKPRPLIQRRHTIAVTTATSIRLSAAEMKVINFIFKLTTNND